MTMILAAACYDFAVLVGDRMVSLTRGERYQGEHDPRFNKLMIMAFRDAIAALGFSGPAYLDGVPTDQWIATSITGVDMRHGTFTSFRPRSHPRSIGAACHRIRTALQQVEHGREVQLLMTGHRIVREKNWPLLMFQKPGAARLDLRPFGRADLRMSWVGSKPDVARYNREVGDLVARKALDANTMTSLLASLVRQEAQRNVQVGNDLHLVIMDRWSEKVVCRYDPMANRQPEHTDGWEKLFGVGGSIHDAGEALPTPWVIGARLIVPPTERYGESEVTAMIGHGPVLLTGPATSASGFSMSSSAKRTPQP